jgi:protein tyrosine/serine phosphatase
MIQWVIPKQLARSSRPGIEHQPSDKVDVEKWIVEAKTQGIRSIICLLSQQEIREFYCAAGINLFACYRETGFEVAHFPVSDSGTPPRLPELLVEIGQRFSELPKPCLVHCNAGIDRTRHIIDYLCSL